MKMGMMMLAAVDENRSRSRSGSVSLSKYQSWLSTGEPWWFVSESRCSDSHMIYNRSVNKTLSDDYISNSKSENGDETCPPLSPLDFIL